ncbi:MAG: M28 family peptidase [Gemmatimonadota bacterium]
MVASFRTLCLASLGASAALVRPLPAQTSHPLDPEHAALGISADDLRTRIGIIADDSMGGRDTPSPGLEKTARYIADQFRSFGLAPGVGDSYLQHYPLTVVRPGPAEAQEAVLHGPEGDIQLAGELVHTRPEAGRNHGSGPIVRLASAAEMASARGRVALLRLNRSELRHLFRGLPRSAATERPAAVIVALDVDDQNDGLFERLVGFLARRRMTLGEPGEPLPPILYVRAADLPASLGEATAAEDGTLAGWTAEVQTEGSLERLEAMNTIGILEGSDPELRDEYVFFTAHMDHIGISHGASGDSINNGADDDGSGTATVVELAQAFASLETRPRRSLVFMTVSGEEKGLFGSRWYSENPVLPLERTVADLNIDMIGRNWPDSVVVIGKNESSMGALVERIASEHPELDMVPIDDRWPEENFYSRSDHFNFARKGVPILFFFSGVHEDYHRPGDEPSKILYDKTARIGRLVFLLGLEVANADERPSWDPEAYKRVVESSSR